MPGMEAMRAQQEAFMKAMTRGELPKLGSSMPASDEDDAQVGTEEEIDEIKKQLADLQQKLSKMDK
jgi:hypothetical protein